MDQNPTTSAELRLHQISAYLAILNGLVWIVGGLALAMTVVALGAGLVIEFVVLAAGMLIFAASSVAARAAVRRGRLMASLLFVSVPMFMIAIGSSFVFPNASIFIVYATVIMMLIAGMVISPRAVLPILAAGLLIFIPCLIAATLGSFDAAYARVGVWGSYIAPIISVAALSFMGLLVFILNAALLQALHESDQRGRIAETALADQSGMLDQVQRQAADQARLLELVRDLETPVIPLFAGVVALPVVGHLDPQRMEALTGSLLGEVTRHRAHTVIVDLTGVTMIDTATANHLLQMAQAIRLVGASIMITGMRAEVAQMLVSLEIAFDGIATAASLQDGIMRVSAALDQPRRPAPQG